MRILLSCTAALLLAAPCAHAASRQVAPTTATAAAAAVCDSFAAAGASTGSPLSRHGVPGSWDNPFATPQRLVSALGPGQTGCLRGGTYQQGGSELAFRRSGSRGAPITLRSAPGERATIVGGPIYVPSTSDDIRIERLNIDTSSTGQMGVQIMSDDDALIRDRITNHQDRASCVILGNNEGWGQATGTVLRDDVIHDCGSPLDGNQDHAIYFDNSVGASVTGSQIWGTAGFAIHLYENARRNVIRHNVIDHNRYGVIFGANAGYRSSGNVVADNVIADTTDSYAVQSWWAGLVGHGNVVANNCIYRAAKGAIARPTTGFEAVGNVIAQPHFVDSTRHDYGLLPGSGCLRVVGFDAARSLAASSRHHGSRARR